MRKYEKNAAPEELSGWNWKKHSWEEFMRDRNAYNPVIESLKSEQFQICCYCEKKLKDQNCHIEHFQPRNGNNSNRSLTFNYVNLACSCNGGHGGERHCGHFKGSNFDPVKFLNPSSQTYSSKYFIFTIDGRIASASDLNVQEKEKADYMIDLLNLNSPDLVSRRRTHTVELMNCMEIMEDISWLIQDYSEADSEGALKNFYSLSCQILRIVN